MNPQLNEEELKNLFYFLSNSEARVGESVLKESLIFGLENYALAIPGALANIKYQIIKANSGDKISFEEFKHLWTSHIDSHFDRKEFAKFTFQMMKDVISKENIENGKINKRGIIELQQHFLVGNTPMNETKNDTLANELIEAIDVEGDGKIDLNDVEFLVDEYIKHNFPQYTKY